MCLILLKMKKVKKKKKINTKTDIKLRRLGVTIGVDGGQTYILHKATYILNIL